MWKVQCNCKVIICLLLLHVTHKNVSHFCTKLYHTWIRMLIKICISEHTLIVCLSMACINFFVKLLLAVCLFFTLLGSLPKTPSSMQPKWEHSKIFFYTSNFNIMTHAYLHWQDFWVRLLNKRRTSFVTRNIWNKSHGILC